MKFTRRRRREEELEEEIQSHLRSCVELWILGSAFRARSGHRGSKPSVKRRDVRCDRRPAKDVDLLTPLHISPDEIRS
jgi:hypothetical protein